MNLKWVFEKYRKLPAAVPAFNLDTFLIYQAVEKAVEECRMPTIVQLSSQEETFLGAEKLVALIKLARKKDIPMFLNLDHGKDIRLLKECIKMGFDMVHFDGSNLAINDNLKTTKELVKYAKQKGVMVEVEIDKIGSTDTKAPMTNPISAREFMKKTGAQLLAVAVGNQHGMTKEGEKLNLTHFKELKDALPNTLFTLHGGSGVPRAHIHKAIALGTVKININTQLRIVAREAMAQTLRDEKSIKGYDYFGPVRDTLAKTVKGIITDFA